MRIDPAAEPITADDDTIKAVVAQADLPALLVAVAHTTGDLSLLKPTLRPDPAQLLAPDAGLTSRQLKTGRLLATQALIRYRDAGSPPPPPVTPETLQALLEFLVVDEGNTDLYQMLREEVAVEGDLRAPGWRKDDVAPDRPFTVAVVGAGMSGIVAAHRLQQAGVPFVVFEKNPDVGGTWFENTYPGCRVDTPNHLYSYSFAQSSDWPQLYSSQGVLLDYFRTCTELLGLRPAIRFGTEVVAATWEDDDQCWSLQVRSADGAGPVETLRFAAVFTAVGQLNRPLFPTIVGRDDFGGPAFHSARWDDDVDLAGKRVAVIGTGASAVQLIPLVAEEAAEVTVYQRTPPWLIPTPEYHEQVSDGVRWLLDHVPGYVRWDRVWQFWRMHEGLLPLAVVDPEWAGEGSVSQLNSVLRDLLIGYLREQFPEDELFAQAVPPYPPVAKRVIRDNGSWARTLRRDNVELVSEPIGEITATGISTEDGVERPTDVIIYGTGFSASQFLTPMQVTGRGGVDLHERWKGDARAYLGVTVPEFPNLFMLYGPNTNIVINGSIIYFSECAAHYGVEAIRLLLEGGGTSIECRPEVHDEYNVQVDEGNRRMAWGVPGVRSWYKNEHGRVAQNWPFQLLEYWQRTRLVDPDDYIVR